MITSQQLWFSNLKIVRATNSLTISGTVVKAGSPSIINLRIFNTLAKIEPNRVFTIVASVKDRTRCSSDTRIARIGGNIWYYKKDEHGKDIRIADIVSSTNTALDINKAAIWIYPDVATYGENFTFSITIYDVACYYGAFTNPPALKSPDVLPSNVFEISGSPMKNLNTVKTYNIGWYRILCLSYDAVSHNINDNSSWINRIGFHTFYFLSGYHAAGSPASENYSNHEITIGINSTLTSDTRIFFEVRNVGRDVLIYSKFRLAVGPEVRYMSAPAGQTAKIYERRSLYLETYYNRKVDSSNSTLFADNIEQNMPRIDNISGNPDGNDDWLVGSEVVPTLIGTKTTIPYTAP